MSSSVVAVVVVVVVFVVMEIFSSSHLVLAAAPLACPDLARHPPGWRLALSALGLSAS